MSLILVFHNDGTGGESDANYNIRVLIGDGTAQGSRVIDGGRVTSHNRAEGWRRLVWRFLKESEERTWLSLLDTAPPLPPALPTKRKRR